MTRRSALAPFGEHELWISPWCLTWREYWCTRVRGYVSPYTPSSRICSSCANHLEWDWDMFTPWWDRLSQRKWSRAFRVDVLLICMIYSSFFFWVGAVQSARSTVAHVSRVWYGLLVRTVHRSDTTPRSDGWRSVMICCDPDSFIHSFITSYHKDESFGGA